MYRFLFLALFITSTSLYGGRSIVQVINPNSRNWYNDVDEIINIECSILNEQTTLQTVTVEAISNNNALNAVPSSASGTSTKGTNASPLSLSTHTEVLQKFETMNLWWSSRASTNFPLPKALVISIAENQGAVSGSCVIHYRNYSAVPVWTTSSIAILGGRSF